MKKMKIVGHQNPDLDSIASAVALSYLLGLRDLVETEPVKLGEFSKETRYVFERFHLAFEVPTIDRVEDAEEVILVDHNEFSQSVANIENATIKMVWDHHKIDNFRTKEPLEFIAKPFGSTASIIYQALKQLGSTDNSDINILLLSAIISDTLLLKSPTTTKLDREYAKELADKLSLNLETYGMELLRAGADVSDVTAKGLLCIDSKVFDANRKNDTNFSSKYSRHR